MASTGDNFRAFLRKHLGDSFGNTPPEQPVYPVADKVWELAKAATQQFRPPTVEAAQQMDSSTLGMFDIPGGGSLAAAPIAKKLAPEALAAEKALNRVKGVYVKPSVVGEAGLPVDLGNDLTMLVSGPGKGLSKYKALGEMGDSRWKEAIDKAGGSQYDVNPIVKGYDRGNYTELAPEHTLVNKSYVWGNLEKRQKEAAALNRIIPPKPAELPMDEASRMARAKEMGFDTDKVLYHGTNKDFSEFSNKPPSNEDLGIKRLGSYFTENPEIASMYAGQRTGSQIIPTHLKLSNPLDLTKSFRNTRINKNNIEEFVSQFPSDIQEAVRKQALSDMDNKLYPGVASSFTVLDQTPGLRESLQRAGYDGLHFQDWIKDKRGPVSVAFEPSQIRSTNAKFDPAKKNSGNILDAAIGTAGAGALGASLVANQAEAQEPSSDVQAKERALEMLLQLQKNPQMELDAEQTQELWDRIRKANASSRQSSQ